MCSVIGFLLKETPVYNRSEGIVVFVLVTPLFIVPKCGDEEDRVIVFSNFQPKQNVPLLLLIRNDTLVLYKILFPMNTVLKILVIYTVVY